MAAIAVISLVGYVIVFFVRKTAEIVHNAKGEENWIYIKHDIANHRTFWLGYYINELAAVRDFLIPFPIVYFYETPQYQQLIPLLLVLGVLVVRCITFAKKNIIENVVMIISEFLILLLQCYFYYDLKVAKISPENMPTFVTTVAIIFCVVVFFGLIAAMIYDLVAFALLFKRFASGEFLNMYRRVSVNRLKDSKSMFDFQKPDESKNDQINVINGAELPINLKKI